MEGAQAVSPRRPAAEVVRTPIKKLHLGVDRSGVIVVQARGRLGDTWYLDELFVNIQDRRQYLWRAVDQDGDVIDLLVQSRRNRRAAARFFRKLLKAQGHVPLCAHRADRTATVATRPSRQPIATTSRRLAARALARTPASS